MKDNQLWLHKLFNSPYFNTWSTISYLSRYNSNGIRYYLLQKLRTADIGEVYPQLVSIYKSEFNYPLYRFLSEPNLVIYFLVRNDKHELDKEMLSKARIRVKRYRGLKKHSYGEEKECGEKHPNKVNAGYMKEPHSENCNTREGFLENESSASNSERSPVKILSDNKKSVHSISENDISEVTVEQYKPCRLDVQNNYPEKEEHSIDYNTEPDHFESTLDAPSSKPPSSKNEKTHDNQPIGYEKHKSPGQLEHNNKTENNAKHNTNSNYTLFPTPIISDTEGKLTLHGILLFFVKSVTGLFSHDIDTKLNKYQNTFTKKVHKAHNTKKNIFSGDLFNSNNWLLPSIRFYDELTNICKRLKLLPRNIRQKGLQIELIMINQNMPGNVMDTSLSLNIVNIVTEFSYVLDSAENSPFYIVVEMCSYGGKHSGINCEKAIWPKVNGEQVENMISDTNDYSSNDQKLYNTEYQTEKKDLGHLNMASNLENSEKTNESSINETIERHEKMHAIGINKSDSKHENSIDIIDSSIDLKTCDSELKILGSAHTISNTSQSPLYDDGKWEGAVSISLPEVETKNSLNKIDQPNLILSEPEASDVICLSGKMQHEPNDSIQASGDTVRIKTKCEASAQLEDKAVYRNAAILLHQLYNLNDCASINNAELSVIKEKIISQIQNIKLEHSNSSLTWEQTKKIVREKSKFSNMPNYEVKALIIKRGNDLRQEVLAMQLMQEILNIFHDEKLSIYLSCYKIYLIDKKSALIEVLNDVVSIHTVKKRYRSLKEYYKQTFTDQYIAAVDNFVCSLVGYSLATYFLQVKDRHNGNILLSREGHLIHVDFGFILGSHPGFYNVERAPFKFSQEYIELLGNKMSDFKSMFIEGFMALRRNCDRLCKIVEILSDKGNHSYVSKNVISAFRERFKMDLNDKEAEKYVVGLISWSLSSMGTGLYDSYQYFSHGYRK